MLRPNCDEIAELISRNQIDKAKKCTGKSVLGRDDWKILKKINYKNINMCALQFIVDSLEYNFTQFCYNELTSAPRYILKHFVKEYRKKYIKYLRSTLNHHDVPIRLIKYILQISKVTGTFTCYHSVKQARLEIVYGISGIYERAFKGKLTNPKNKKLYCFFLLLKLLK